MNKKIAFLSFIVFILLIIMFPLIYTSSNIGLSLSKITIKKGNRIDKLNEIVISENKKFILFFSYKCSTCRQFINNTLYQNKFIIINIDFDKKIPDNIFKLIPTKEINISYIPYIVETDSSEKIIKEYNLEEIEEKIENSDVL